MKSITAIPSPAEDSTGGQSHLSLPQIPFGKPKTGDSAVLKLFQQILNDDHYWIKNCSIFGTGKESPPLLVGPLGVTLIFENTSHGIYRANGINWEIFDEARKQYRSESPNPIVHAIELSQKVVDFLSQQGFAHIPVQAVIIFTHPGVHLELNKPAVRMLPLDGLGRYITSIAHAIPTINLAEIPQVVQLLAPYTEEKDSLFDEIHDGFSFKEEKPKKPIKLPEVNIPLPKDDGFVKTVNKVPFTTRQLLLLAGLVIINIIILISLVMVVLSYHN
ncbi:MAG: hypothetical protein ACPL4H_07800 [Anaerolineales bacterium]